MFDFLHNNLKVPCSNHYNTMQQIVDIIGIDHDLHPNQILLNELYE